MLNRARDKFFANGDALTREFFTCMDTKSSTLNAKWLGGLKKKIERICFERAMNSGNLTDYSESERLDALRLGDPPHPPRLAE